MIGAASPGSFAIGKKRVKNSPAAGLRHIESSFHLYDSLQKRIWNYAETCYEEVRSAEQWASYLESCGFTVERALRALSPMVLSVPGT